MLARGFQLALLSLQPGGSGKDFLGFPIPSAAALVASLTLLMMWIDEKDFSVGYLRYVLPVLMLFLSWMKHASVT